MSLSENPVKALIQLCLRYASSRMHSKQEMLKYLEGKGAEPESIEAVIDYLETNDLVNDREFSSQWAQSRLKRGKGGLIIQAELYQKGVPKEVVGEVISSISPQMWLESVSYTARKYQSKWQSLTGYEQKAKLFQILRMRGYSGRHIDAFVRSRVE